MRGSLRPLALALALFTAPLFGGCAESPFLLTIDSEQRPLYGTRARWNRATGRLDVNAAWESGCESSDASVVVRLILEVDPTTLRDGETVRYALRGTTSHDHHVLDPPEGAFSFESTAGSEPSVVRVALNEYPAFGGCRGQTTQTFEGTAELTPSGATVHVELDMVADSVSCSASALGPAVLEAAFDAPGVVLEDPHPCL